MSISEDALFCLDTTHEGSWWWARPNGEFGVQMPESVGDIFRPRGLGDEWYVGMNALVIFMWLIDEPVRPTSIRALKARVPGMPFPARAEESVLLLADCRLVRFTGQVI